MTNSAKDTINFDAAERKMRPGRFASVMPAACALALSACGPMEQTPAESHADALADAAKEEADTTTPPNPFFGSWAMTSAKIAPWWDGKGEEPAPDPAFAANVVLAADKSSGPPIVTCDKPAYVLDRTQPQSLFEGNLPDPVKDAAALGFSGDKIVTLNFTCASGAADVSLDFPMKDPSTIMLGLDNVIYTFRFVGG